MADPGLALHKALYAALNTACSCQVYDGVPQGAAFPYAVMEYSTSENDDFLSSRMDYRVYFVTVHSELNGQREVLSIMAEMDTLNNQPLTLDTGAVASLRVDSKRTYRDADALTFKGLVVLRVITTH